MEMLTFDVSFSMNEAFSPSPVQIELDANTKELLVRRERGNVTVHLTEDLVINLVKDLELTLTGDRFVVVVMCVFIVLFYGYLGIENTYFTNLIIGLFSLTIPVIAIYPLLISLREISKVKKKKLRIFGNVLNNSLKDIEIDYTISSISNHKGQITNFLEIQQIYNIINNMNVFPFNPKALASVVFIYAFQVILTIYKLITG